MKIILTNYTASRFYPGIDKVEGLGASDAAVIRVADYLARWGHEVTIYSNSERAIEGYENVNYRSGRPTEIQECDALISNRVPMHLDAFKAKKRFYWTHDNIDAPAMTEAAEFIKLFDGVICLSKYHSSRLGSLGEHRNVYIIPEGIQDNSINEEWSSSKNVVYCSAPFKGLHILAKAWPEINKACPDMVLNICSGMGLYGAEGQDRAFKKIYDDLEKMPNVVFHGVKTNAYVQGIIKSSKFMLYPNSFAETYGAAVAEAIGHGVPVITSKLGALPEVVGRAGLLIEGNPMTKEYRDTFIDRVVAAWKYEALQKELREAALDRSLELPKWDDVGKKFKEMLEQEISEVQ